MRRILIACALAALLLAAANVAAPRLLPPPLTPKEAHRVAGIMRAEGPVVFTNRPSDVSLDGLCLVVRTAGRAVAAPPGGFAAPPGGYAAPPGGCAVPPGGCAAPPGGCAAWPVPDGARAKGFRLEDLNRDGRYEVFVILEFPGDEGTPRRVEEVGVAFRPLAGEVARGHLVSFLRLPLLVDAKRLPPDGRVWEEVTTYAPADAPAGVWPDLIVSRKRYFWPADAESFTPGGVVEAKTLPPVRLRYDAAHGGYGAP